TQLNAFGNLQFSSEQDLNGVLGGSLTRFLTDQFEVGVTSLLLFTNGDIGGSLGGLFQFNVTNQSLWLPYIGVSSGVLWIGGETLGGVSGDFRIGIRRFVSENVSFNVEVSQRYQYEDEFQWDEFDVIPVSFGLSVFFN
ncbi:MAG: hypothetical protein HKO53_20145, partial [Gemmatimonadetes bacterium]|nr:hypothetical protein [Gemmatimonadota bacterium]